MMLDYVDVLWSCVCCMMCHQPHVFACFVKSFAPRKPPEIHQTSLPRLRPPKSKESLFPGLGTMIQSFIWSLYWTKRMPKAKKKCFKKKPKASAMIISKKVGMDSRIPRLSHRSVLKTWVRDVQTCFWNLKTKPYEDLKPLKIIEALIRAGISFDSGELF